MRTKIAFTLSEVLITLGIIGIVAAITIPALVKSYHKKITVTRLKQTYSMFQQALKLSELEHGDISQWDIPNVIDATASSDRGVSEDFADEYFLKYIKGYKKCDLQNDVPKTCKYMDGKTCSTVNRKGIAWYILQNGTKIYIWPRGNWGEIGIITYDTRKDLIVGKNGFILLYYKSSANKLNFYGWGKTREELMTTGYPCAKTGTLAGIYCGALIMLDNWEIKDDYPW